MLCALRNDKFNLSMQYAIMQRSGPAMPSLMRANNTGFVSGIPREPMTEPPPNETCAVMIAIWTRSREGAGLSVLSLRLGD